MNKKVKGEDGKIKSFFKGIGGYAKHHPWMTAGLVAVGAFGLLLIAAGIVLAVTAPATFGGGAVAGGVLFGVGGSLAAGVVAIAGGVVLTGSAAGLFWSSARKEKRRNDLLQKMEMAGVTPLDVVKPQAAPKKQKSAATRRKGRVNKDKIQRKPVNEAQLHTSDSGIFAHHSSTRVETKKGQDKKKEDDENEGKKIHF